MGLLATEKGTKVPEESSIGAYTEKASFRRSINPLRLNSGERDCVAFSKHIHDNTQVKEMTKTSMNSVSSDGA